MIFDGTLKFSDNQNLATTGETVSTNTWDRGRGAGRLYGNRIRIAAFAVNDPALTSATTLTVKIQASTDNSEWVDKYTVDVGGDELAAGKPIVEGIPVLLTTGERYVRINYNLSGTAATTAPAVTAFVAMDGTQHADHEFVLKD